MKTFTITSILLITIIVGASSAQTVFTVRPGSQLSSASIGKEMGALTVFGGFDFFMASTNVEFKNEDWDQDWYSGEDLFHSSDETLNMEASAKFVIPHIGAKLNLGSGSGAVRPYVQATLFKVMPMVSLSGSHERTSFDPDGNVTWHDVEDFNDGEAQNAIEEVKDALSAVGLTLGFGSEYYLADNFSLGGEFGVRFMKFDHSGGMTFEDGDGEEIYDRDILTDDISLTLGLTYSNISLNYYF